MSYNTQFKVKYYDIQQELTNKLHIQIHEEHEYSCEDVADVCNKLYRDELLSVFGAEEITDDKIDLGMKYVFEKMCIYVEFNSIIEELLQLCIDAFTFLQKDQINTETLSNFKQLITILLFSQQIFHITHNCICQLFEFGTIDNSLLVQLRQHCFELIQNQIKV